MTNSIEVEFNKNVVWVIKEIEKDFLTSQQTEIRFELKTRKDAPLLDDQRRAITFLETKKAIKVISTQPFSSSFKSSSLGITSALELEIQPLIYFLTINKPILNSVYKILSETEPTSKYIKSLPLPTDCNWEGLVFNCGNKQLSFKPESDTYKYFKLLTNQLGSPVFNQDVFRQFDCEKPSQISNGVRKSLANRIQNLSLDKRVKIVFTGDDPKVKQSKSGYTCYID